MHALLVLLRAEGRTVSRDQLVDACWDGRVVSEDAISRVIAQVRGLASQFEPPPFRLETIPKIGFRLTPAEPRGDGWGGSIPDDTPSRSSAASDARRMLRRRVAVGAAAAAAVAGFGGAGWWATARSLPKPARAALEGGLAAFRQMTPDQSTQAIAAFERAAALAPRHAEGWAWLALAYQYQSRSGAPADSARILAQRAGEAARRALAIAPENAEAGAALAALRPTADWIPTRAALATLLARHPRNFSVNRVAMDFYVRTGQLGLANGHAKAALAADPAWPKLFTTLALSSWSMGRLNDADGWMARGYSQWPRHYSLWFARQRLLSYTGRAAQALAMVDDVDGRPVGVPEWNFDQCRLETRALLTHSPTDVAAAATGYRALIPRGVGFAQNAMQFLSAVGQLDEAFTVLEALLLNRGQALSPSLYSPEQGQYYTPDRRDTWMLWMPAVAPMRDDDRMLPIVRAIGLADYWRITASGPATPISGL